MAEKYPSNSNKLREASLVRGNTEIRTTPTEISTTPSHEIVEVEKTIRKEPPAGLMRTRNVSTAKAIFAALFPEGLNGFKEKLIWEMLVPRLQRFLHEGWDDMGDVLFQDGGRSRRYESNVPYNSIYRGGRNSNDQSDAFNSRRGVYDYQEYVWRTREQAEDLLRRLNAILAKYRVLRLLDYNEELGFPTHPGQAYYGWISLKTARIDRTYDRGWVVVMPRPVEIDNRN